MAWRDMLYKLMQDKKYEEDDYDPFEEGGEEEESMSSRKKADLERTRIKARQMGGPELERKVTNKADFEIAEKSAEDEIEKRRILAEIRKKYKLSSNEDAEKVLDEFGGVRAYLKKFNMADSDDRERDSDTIRAIADQIRRRLVDNQQVVASE